MCREGERVAVRRAARESERANCSCDSRPLDLPVHTHAHPRLSLCPLSILSHFFAPLTFNAQTSVHSLKHVLLSLKPSAKTTGSFLSVAGPNPGAPAPPRTHPGMHFLKQLDTAGPSGPDVSSERRRRGGPSCADRADG